MKTFFFRTQRSASLGGACIDAPVSVTLTRVTVHAKPIDQQLRELDTLTHWPTHRIRNFLVTQARDKR